MSTNFVLTVAKNSLKVSKLKMAILNIVNVLLCWPKLLAMNRTRLSGVRCS